MSMAQMLRDGQPICGTMLRMAREPAAAAMVKHAGFDFFMLDMEHGPYSFEVVTDFVLVAHAYGIGAMVRVPELTKGYVSRALDCGVDGVMVPMLETVTQAEQLVNWSKYPPLGRRGLGSIGGNSDYATPAPAAQFMTQANQRVIAIAQVETVTGVNNAPAIAAIDGIDALVVGPNDLANSLGKPGQMTCPEEDAAIEKIATAAQSAGKTFGMHATAELLRRWSHRNMRLILNSIDISVLTAGLAALNQETRDIAAEAMQAAQA